MIWFERSVVYLGLVFLTILGCTREPQYAVERTNVGNGGNNIVAQFKVQSRKVLRRWNHSLGALEFASRVGISPSKIEWNLFNEDFIISVSSHPLNDRLGNPVHARLIENELRLEQTYWSDLLATEVEATPLILHELLRIHPPTKAGMAVGSLDDDFSLSSAIVGLLNSTQLKYAHGVSAVIGLGGCDFGKVEIQVFPSRRLIELSFHGILSSASSFENLRSSINFALSKNSCEVHFSTGDTLFDGQRPSDFEVETIASTAARGAVGVLEISIGGDSEVSIYQLETSSITAQKVTYGAQHFVEKRRAEQVSSPFKSVLRIKSLVGGTARASLTPRTVLLRYP